MQRTLTEVHEWALERLYSGTEPAWKYYRLMQLLDALDGLRDPEAQPTKGSSSQSGRPPAHHSDGDAEPAAPVFQLSDARRRRKSGFDI